MEHASERATIGEKVNGLINGVVMIHAVCTSATMPLKSTNSANRCWKIWPASKT